MDSFEPKKIGTKQRWDTWHDVGHDLSSKQKGNLGQKITLSAMFHARLREEGKRRAKSFLPRSTKFRQSKFVRLRTKVHSIDEGYARFRQGSKGGV